MRGLRSFVAIAAAITLGVVTQVSGAAPVGASSPGVGAGGMTGVRLRDVAERVGLTFRQGSFRFGVSADPVSMMGGGLCWLDYDGDGWLDLFVVNSYSDRDVTRWQQHGGLPGSVLFHNVKGKFVDVTRRVHARLVVRGTGCVAADLDQDGNTDLYVTAAGRSSLL